MASNWNKRTLPVFTLIAIFCPWLIACQSEEAADVGSQRELLVRADQAYKRGDYNVAQGFYKKLAQAGVPQGQAGVANMYRQGRGVDQDIEESIHWFKKAANQDWVPAQYQLGFIYQNVGPVRDLDEAIRFYRMAASDGNAKAQLNLANMFAKGVGVRKDIKKAISYYRDAALQGQARAMRALAGIYETAEGKSRDVKSAYGWYYLAAKRGSNKAKQKVKTYNRQLKSSEIERLQQAMDEWEEKNIQK